MGSIGFLRTRQIYGNDNLRWRAAGRVLTSCAEQARRSATRPSTTVARLTAAMLLQAALPQAKAVREHAALDGWRRRGLQQMRGVLASPADANRVENRPAGEDAWDQS